MPSPRVRRKSKTSLAAAVPTVPGDLRAQERAAGVTMRRLAKKVERLEARIDSLPGGQKRNDLVDRYNELSEQLDDVITEQIDVIPYLVGALKYQLQQQPKKAAYRSNINRLTQEIKELQSIYQDLSGRPLATSRARISPARVVHMVAVRKKPRS